MALARSLGVSVLVSFFAFACAAHADTPLYVATVSAFEAEVRSGAGTSLQLYPTNRLRKGDRVEVVKELEGGWLAIKPPPGSFSWINSRFVQQIVPGKPMWVVVTAPDARVPLLLGSDLRTDKPTVEGARVTRGTQLRAVGPMRDSDDGRWLPVEPPPSEVRYIRAEAVSRVVREAGAAVAPPGATLVKPTQPDTPNPANPANSAVEASPADDPRWQRARQAEQAGRYDEAIQLYQQLGKDLAKTDYSLSLQALNRAHALETRPGAARSAPGAETRYSPPPPPGASGAKAASTTITLPAGWVSSGPGRLSRTGSNLDYQRLYTLLNSQGRPILYVIAQPGFSLEEYVDRNLEVYGVRVYRNDLRAYLLTAMQVRQLP
jgi:hypothetical protein